MTSPPPTTNSAGPVAAVGPARSGLSGTETGLSEPVSTPPAAVHGLGIPAAAGQTPWANVIGIMNSVNNFMSIPVESNFIDGAVNTAAWFAMTTVPTVVGLIHTLAGSAPAAAAAQAGTGAAAGGPGGGILASAVAPAAATGSTVVPVVAGLGQACYLEGLSVPPGWAAAADRVTPVANPPAGVPPLAPAKREGLSSDTQRRGVAPRFIPTQMLA